MRKTKIIATLGPASSTDACHPRADRRRRRRLPPQLLARHARGRTPIVIARIRRAAQQSGRIDRVAAGPQRAEDSHRPAARAHAAAAGGRRCADDCRRRLRRRAGPRLDDVRSARVWSAPATACSSTMAASSCGSRTSSTGELQTTVVDGGPLGEHKGINVPGVEFPATGLTDKDIDDLRFGAEAGCRLRRAELRAERGRAASGARSAARGGRARHPARRQARTPGGRSRASRRSCTPATR